MEVKIHVCITVSVTEVGVNAGVPAYSQDLLNSVYSVCLRVVHVSTIFQAGNPSALSFLNHLRVL